MVSASTKGLLPISLLSGAMDRRHAKESVADALSAGLDTSEAPTGARSPSA